MPCRGRRKRVPWLPIVKAAPVLMACKRPLGVVDGSVFTVMVTLAGLLPSRTPPPRPSATIATAQLCLTCRFRVRQSAASAKIASISRGRMLSAPLICSYNITDRACARHPRTGAQVRALVRQTAQTARWGLPRAQALVRQIAQTARWGLPQAQFHPR